MIAINAETGQSFPLISLLAPANHHDSHFRGPLASIGKAVGLDLQLVTADEAYHDNDGAIYDESGVHLGGCPRIAIFSKIKACEKNYRRHMVDIPRIIF